MEFLSAINDALTVIVNQLRDAEPTTMAAAVAVVVVAWFVLRPR